MGACLQKDSYDVIEGTCAEVLRRALSDNNNNVNTILKWEYDTLHGKPQSLTLKERLSKENLITSAFAYFVWYELLQLEEGTTDFKTESMSDPIKELFILIERDDIKSTIKESEGFSEYANHSTTERVQLFVDWVSEGGNLSNDSRPHAVLMRRNFPCLPNESEMSMSSSSKKISKNKVVPANS